MDNLVTYTVNVFKLNKKSKRGYYFKESTVRKYLESDQCHNRLHDRTSLGIITHFGRYDKEDTKSKIPTKDVALINREFTHYISKLFIEEGYLKAELTLLNPELFSGETRDKIMFVRGLILSGVKLTISAGIEAYYNPITKEGEEIYDIIGIDFTLDPDFI